MLKRRKYELRHDQVRPNQSEGQASIVKMDQLVLAIKILNILFTLFFLSPESEEKKNSITNINLKCYKTKIEAHEKYLLEIESGFWNEIVFLLFLQCNTEKV